MSRRCDLCARRHWRQNLRLHGSLWFCLRCEERIIEMLLSLTPATA